MLMPIRCFSCGFPIAIFKEDFDKEVASGKKPEEVLSKMGVSRYCCRRMLISNVSLIEDIAKFKKG